LFSRHHPNTVRPGFYCEVPRWRGESSFFFLPLTSPLFPLGFDLFEAAAEFPPTSHLSPLVFPFPRFRPLRCSTISVPAFFSHVFPCAFGVLIVRTAADQDSLFLFLLLEFAGRPFFLLGARWRSPSLISSRHRLCRFLFQRRLPFSNFSSFFVTHVPGSSLFFSITSFLFSCAFLSFRFSRNAPPPQTSFPVFPMSFCFCFMTFSPFFFPFFFSPSPRNGFVIALPFFPFSLLRPSFRNSPAVSGHQFRLRSFFFPLASFA